MTDEHVIDRTDENVETQVDRLIAYREELRQARRPDYMPSPAEVDRRAAKIRSEWSEDEALRRARTRRRRPRKDASPHLLHLPEGYVEQLEDAI